MMNADGLREMATDALRYWEPRRLFYNALLAAVVLVHFGVNWPGSRQALQLDLVLVLFMLAVLANVAYCAAYVPICFCSFHTTGNSGHGGARSWQRWGFFLRRF